MTIDTNDPGDVRNYDSDPTGNVNPTMDDSTKKEPTLNEEQHPILGMISRFLKVFPYIGVYTYQVDKLAGSIEFRIKLFDSPDDEHQKPSKPPQKKY
jgi:hypothetical protein